MGRITYIIRIYICAILVLLFFAYIGSWMYYVQIVRNQELYSKAKKVYTTVKNKKGERGRIFDYSGNLIVGNIPCADLVADPKITGNDEQCKDAARLLAVRLKMPALEIFESLSVKKRGDFEIRYKVIRKDLTLEAAKDIQNLIRKNNLKGIFIEEKTRRFYPKGELLSNIVGITNNCGDTIKPVNGIEKAFNESLTPTKVRNIYERDIKGVPFSYGKKEIFHERNGSDIFLTIQEPLQLIVEEELENLVKEFKPRSAYAIMADPYTGNILAMAQRPTFNPNNRKNITPDMWRDRFLTDVFEPGSTMKTFPVSGALDYCVVTPNTMFDCERGRWAYAGKILRDSHPEGVLSVTDIIKVSINIGTAKIALLLGEKRLYHVLKRFGFGQKTGIPIEPESVGQFKKLSNWDKLSITRFPIGQGISCTPIQLVRAYCAIANGGNLVKMRLVDREQNPDTGEIVFKEIPPPTKVFLRDDTCEKIKAMLKLVTREGGTGIKARVPGYDVAGKTGTSQKWVDGAYSGTLFFATFVGFVPADNPAFVLLVMADEPKGNHYGGVVSAPTFRRIAEKALRFLNIPPQYPEEIKELSKVN
ncbi:MAG: penicillin-binding protein 2 [Candidatus Nanoarchaeia archaeon]